mgnify:FL=1
MARPWGRLVGRPAPGHRGQAIVELALLLPILVLLLLGALDLGRAYYFYTGVANATRVGAQYAIDPKMGLTEAGKAEIKNAVIAEASPYVALTEDRINLSTAGWQQWNDLTVSVAFDFHFLTPLAARLWGDPITMVCQTTVRFE